MGLAHFFAEGAGTVAQVARSGVFSPVNPMPESHNPAAVVQNVAAILLSVFRLADFQRHFHNFLGGATVGWAFKSSDTGDYRRVQVGNGGSGHPGSKGRSVGPVLGMEDKINVQQLGSLLVGQFIEQHIEEVPGEAQVRVGGYRLQAMAQAVVGRNNGRPHSGKAYALAYGSFSGIVGNLRVKGGKGGNTGTQCIHRMAVLDQVQDLDNLVRYVTVGTENPIKGFQFLPGRELAIKQKIDHFFKGRFLGQVVDVVAAVEEFSLFAVNKAGCGSIQVNIL